MKINESISISQDPKKIWDYLLLVSTDVQWRQGYTKTEWTSQPPYGVGSTGTHHHKDLGPIPWTIVKWEEGCHMEWKMGECKLKDSIGFYHLETEGKGTRITVYSNMVLPFFMKIIMAFVGRKVVKGDLKKLKALMEN
jgi:hypothetical protein